MEWDKCCTNELSRHSLFNRLLKNRTLIIVEALRLKILIKIYTQKGQNIIIITKRKAIYIHVMYKVCHWNYITKNRLQLHSFLMVLLMKKISTRSHNNYGLNEYRFLFKRLINTNRTNSTPSLPQRIRISWFIAVIERNNERGANHLKFHFTAKELINWTGKLGNAGGTAWYSTEIRHCQKRIYLKIKFLQYAPIV